jgi:hypothetical protein
MDKKLIKYSPLQIIHINLEEKEKISDRVKNKKEPISLE